MTSCPHEVEFAERLRGAEELGKSNLQRLVDLEAWRKDQSELVRSVSTLANEQKHIKTDVEEIKTDVKAIAEKPGKRWEAVVEKIILLAAGAVVSFLLTRAGL